MGSKSERRAGRTEGALWRVVDRAVQGGWGTTARLGLLLIIIVTAGAGGGAAVVHGGVQLIQDLGSIIGQNQ